MSFPSNVLPSSAMRMESGTTRAINEERIALMRLRGDFGKPPQHSADI